MAVALVTGAEGFIGANLCKHLLEQGYDVVGTVLNRKGHTSLDALGVDIRLEYGDVRDLSFLRRVVNASEAQLVFHLAAVSVVRIAEADPYRAIETNVLGTLNVLEAAWSADVVVVASSDKAYGDYGGRAYVETMALQPGEPYELSKALADSLARGWDAVVARCANVYGPGDLHWSRLVPNTCRRAVAGKPPELHPRAFRMMREWLHVEDAAAAYLTLAEYGKPGDAYNVGSGQRTSPAMVATRLADAARINQPPVESDWLIGEIPVQELVSTKMRGLGWRPEHDLYRSLPGIYEWYRDYLCAS